MDAVPLRPGSNVSLHLFEPSFSTRNRGDGLWLSSVSWEQKVANDMVITAVFVLCCFCFMLGARQAYKVLLSSSSTLYLSHFFLSQNCASITFLGFSLKNLFLMLWQEVFITDNFCFVCWRCPHENSSRAKSPSFSLWNSLNHCCIVFKIREIVYTFVISDLDTNGNPIDFLSCFVWEDRCAQAGGVARV